MIVHVLRVKSDDEVAPVGHGPLRTTQSGKPRGILVTVAPIGTTSSTWFLSGLEYGNLDR